VRLGRGSGAVLGSGRGEAAREGKVDLMFMEIIICFLEKVLYTDSSIYTRALSIWHRLDIHR